MATIERLIDGLAFGEGPRWHEGRLWYSDMHHGGVFAVDTEGAREHMCTVPGRPSGLGWLPDGRLLVVSMQEERLYRREPDGSLVLHADLSEATTTCNDMVVAADGTAYVGHIGFDPYAPGAEPAPASIIGVRPDGSWWVAATDLMIPNGSVITADHRTLIVGETLRERYRAFPLRPDATLDIDQRRTWASVPGAFPDGCTMDSGGGIWFADARHDRVMRVVEGGEITDTVLTPMRAYACMLGGEDGRTLFVMCSPGSGPHRRGKTDGAIYITQVDLPRAGLP